MKRRLVLCALGILLSLSAIASRPAAACANTCNVFDCDAACRQRGYLGGSCTISLCDSRCLCYN